MTAYYNEIDPYAAQWLRNLIDAGHIAPGIVDERSIEDVLPEDLREFTQCHFFAGIGVWSLALRRAGWPDDKPIWTGSCPCQPFSSAGAGAGFADERHLWPAFHHLIRERRPAIIVGEQVASKDADPWLDLVQTDLEALGYAFGAVAFPSASIGAPHIRDRTYWVADLHGKRRGEARQRELSSGCAERAERHSESGGLADSSNSGQQRRRPGETSDGRDTTWIEPERFCDAGQRPGPTNGFWRDADWLACRDGKWRPVEPGTFPLAHGAASRVGRLRAYGNAVNAEAATEFLKAALT